MAKRTSDKSLSSGLTECPKILSNSSSSTTSGISTVVLVNPCFTVIERVFDLFDPALFENIPLNSLAANNGEFIMVHL